MNITSTASAVRVAAAAFCLAAAALAGGTAVAQTKARLSYHWNPDHESAIMSAKFADQVNKRSGGKIRVETFPSGQLFSIRQITSALSAGSVEIGGVVTHNQLSSIDKDWNIVHFPNLFQSIEQQRRFMTESPEGKALRERVMKKANLVHLAYVPVGPYVTFSTRSDMSTIESMKGLKARSLAASERPGFAARSMSVVSLSTEEVYSALQNGMIDTLATVPTAVKAYSWWDHLKFAQLPYAIYADAELMANGTWFAALPKDQQALLLEVGREISQEATARSMSGNEAALKEMAGSHGGKLTVLTGAALEQFKKLDREKTEPELAKMVSPEILAAARRYVEKK
ncbi:MAG: TRAP transporter substrate-binding protein, partial [Lautropia sp.]